MYRTLSLLKSFLSPMFTSCDLKKTIITQNKSASEILLNVNYNPFKSNKKCMFTWISNCWDICGPIHISNTICNSKHNLSCNAFNIIESYNDSSSPAKVIKFSLLKFICTLHHTSFFPTVFKHKQMIYLHTQQLNTFSPCSLSFCDAKSHNLWKEMKNSFIPVLFHAK